LGEHDGRFTEEHRSRMVRWLLQQLGETTDGIANGAAAAGWMGGEWEEIEAAWNELRRTIEPWLADAEQRIREKETAAA
jgi:hypothetical protein